MSRREKSFSIRIPEGVTFAYPLAGVMSRFLAWVIDLLAIASATLIVGRVISVLHAVSPDVGAAIGTIVFFVLQIGYAMALEWFWRGQTLGKRVLRIRVMDRQGLRLQSHQVILRNLLRLVDSLPVFYMVGGIAVLTSRYAQRLGDIASNTIVVQIESYEEPDFEKLGGSKYNSLLAYRHLAARLRQRVSPDVAAIAVQALLRREELEPPARLQLFEELASHFHTLVEFPPDATEGVSEEQYVRNVVEALYTAR